jgi:phage terminase small subunit
MPTPKKSVLLDALEGNPGHKVIQDIGIEALGEPFIPEHLMDDARGCIEVIKQSMPTKVYSALDSFHLAAFGVAWALHKMAVIKISDPQFKAMCELNVKAAAPWLAILNAQAQVMVSVGARLGLDPASRAALKLPGAKQQKSQFAGLLGQTALLNSSKNLLSPLE